MVRHWGKRAFPISKKLHLWRANREALLAARHQCSHMPPLTIARPPREGNSTVAGDASLPHPFHPSQINYRRLCSHLPLEVSAHPMNFLAQWGRRESSPPVLAGFLSRN